ncbi:MAG: discoidin domain-containing protein [Kiritimatiellaeota bacterium]|nr:discoidin domain-containing protein [Kiritimatiellota bacterium]
MIPSNIKLEVIGVFEHTPDLQYALTTDVRLESPPQIEVTGPWATTAKEGEALDFGVAVEAKNTAGKEALKNAHIEWYVNAPLIQSGSCNQSCKWIASTPGTYNISAILFSRINGKDKPLAFKRGEVTVTADKNKGAAVEPPSPVGTFTAAKEYHGWMTLRVTVGTVTKFKSEDRPGWKNNGTGFTAASVGSGPVTIKIEAIIGKGGSSYFDYAGNVSVKAADGTILAAEKLLIPKDGGNKTCSVVWTPTAKQDSVSVAVGLTGGNPEYYTFFVSGSIGKGTAQAVSAAASTAPAIPLPTVIPTTPTPTPTPPPLVTIPVAPPSTYATPISQTVVRTGNMGGVDNRPTAPTHFTATESYVVTDISTYHWNYGRGTPAPGTIGLRHSDGTLYGPWRAKGTPGQGGVENAIWIVAPNVALKAGIYTLVDSDPNTWSQNAQSGGRGHAEVKAYAARLAPATPQPVVQANRGEPVNLALRKPATQSSTYDHDSATYGPQLGVDGKTNETWLTGFFHTALENAPWWQVDLQKIHVIGEIRVFNRTQQLAERARTIQVQISLNGTDWIIIHRHDGSPWTRLFLPVGGKSARFVRVQLTGEHYLHLKEIEVYGVNEASPR